MRSIPPLYIVSSLVPKLTTELHSLALHIVSEASITATVYTAYTLLYSAYRVFTERGRVGIKLQLYTDIPGLISQISTPHNHKNTSP